MDSGGLASEVPEEDGSSGKQGRRRSRYVQAENQAAFCTCPKEAKRSGI